jgi:hypothetical protein
VDETARFARSARPKVLYLGGTGRSGSTLLARMLGRIPGYAPVGELRYVWERGFVEDHLCECGRPFRACPFWAEVVADAFGGFDSVDVASVQRDLRALDRIRHVPELLTGGLRRTAFRRRLREQAVILGRLYASISAVSGRDVVVDSSKDASYAFLLRALGSVDLAVVHLVRDSRAVAYSWTRVRARPEIHWRPEAMMQRAPWRSAVLWDAHNALFELFAHTDCPFVRVRYEDLVEQPAATLATVAALHGAPLLLDAARTGAEVSGLPVGDELGHSISGNPMRFDRAPLRVKNDDEWVTAMDDRDRRLVTFATGPFLARYGYRIASTTK